MMRHLRATLLRWDGVLVLLAVGLPWLACIVFGFLWLKDHGALVPFLAGSAGLAVVAGLLRRLVRHRPDAGIAEGVATHSVAADPDWHEDHRAIFTAASARIGERVQRPLPWEDVPAEAMATVRDVAARFGRGGELDVTIPEVLLLTERAMSRYRAHVRRMMPFADSLKISTLFWAWQQRETLGKAGYWAGQGYRAIRWVTNPPAAFATEVQGMAASGSTGWLTGQAQAVAQIVLLEEIAFAATELYSGQLKFSDAELLEIGLASSAADRARLALPDAPLRIVVVGQVSAGKSSLINALLGRAMAEADAAPVTDRPVTYDLLLDGTACRLVDMPGLNGAATRAAALAEMMQADMILWAIRANRPGRAEDVRLLADLDAAFAARPQRRRPPIILTATCIDRLIDWPEENRLSQAAMNRVADVSTAIERELGRRPVPLALTRGWNIDTLTREVEAQLAPALMVQRNRIRLEGEASALQAARASGTAAVTAGAAASGRIWKRLSPFGGR